MDQKFEIFVTYTKRVGNTDFRPFHITTKKCKVSEVAADSLRSKCHQQDFEDLYQKWLRKSNLALEANCERFF